MTATPYDRVAYPTALFPQSSPERLAVLARLFGLDPPDPARARILEIGGGDGLSLIAFAAAYPEAEAHNFDLSRAAIERGCELARRAGTPNVTMVVEDILEAHRRYPARSFDYVVAHGVYAWVPEPVRRATMELIGHVLSDRGVAFVSFNAVPGGHVRMIMRDMLLHVLEGIEDPAERLASARAFLASYGEPHAEDEPLVAGLRGHARSMLERPDGVLFHDELGPCYAPQKLSDVIAEAGRCGLRFLTDAGRNRHLDGFLAEDAPAGSDPERAVLWQAQMDDYAVLRFFRQPTFVRAEAPVSRMRDPGRMADMLVSGELRLQEDGSFRHGEDRFTVPDESLAAGLARVASAAPRRFPVREIAPSVEQQRILLHLYNEWHVRLHLDAEPFALAPAERPETSRLVRVQLDDGNPVVCTLDHRLISIDQPELRALLAAADGTATPGELAERLDGVFPADQIVPALEAAAQRALLSA